MILKVFFYKVWVLVHVLPDSEKQSKFDGIFLVHFAKFWYIF